MSRKLFYVTSIVLALSMICSAMGQTGTGLRAEYYTWSGSSPPPRETAFLNLIATRIDPQIYMYWNPGFQVKHPDGLTPDLYIHPPDGLPADNFSVRWSGEIQALKSEAYTFTTGSDDGVRMWLNGVLIIDAWTDHDRAETSSDPIQLVANKKYPIVVEGYENTGEAEWELYWKSTSMATRQLVPQNVLYPAVKAQDYPASKPSPADGAVLKDTWTNIEWTKGPAAVTHDVYFSDNYDDVAAGNPDAFVGNQGTTNIIVGFTGFPCPDGLTIGTTYYWRIDEVNDLNSGSPWKGPVWSFTVAPYTAFGPNPGDGSEGVKTDARLTWVPGYNAKLHFVYFGDNYDTVNNAVVAPPTGLTFFSPGKMELAKVYFWRVDEFDGVTTHKGDIWSFTTASAVGTPNPPYGAINVSQTQKLSWVAGDYAASHRVYFGTDKDAVRNATTASPEYKGPKNLGAESYDPGLLEWDTEYYWRIDEVNDANSNSPWKGNVWSFTTANFFVVDDLESYNNIDPPNPLSNTIFAGWPDGYGTTDNGALVGNDSPPYAARNIVHSGLQSMPYAYDADQKYAEATHKITYPRDWTQKNAETLSLWFKGDYINVAVPMYVAIANTNGTRAVVNHDNPDATRLDVWTEWTIPLQAFADQGVDLTDVDTISIGFGNKAKPQAGGSGRMFFDDIRLYTAPAEEQEQQQ
jgi:hypothetical protein